MQYLGRRSSSSDNHLQVLFPLVAALSPTAAYGYRIAVLTISVAST